MNKVATNPLPAHFARSPNVPQVRDPLVNISTMVSQLTLGRLPDTLEEVRRVHTGLSILRGQSQAAAFPALYDRMLLCLTQGRLGDACPHIETIEAFVRAAMNQRLAQLSKTAEASRNPSELNDVFRLTRAMAEITTNPILFKMAGDLEARVTRQLLPKASCETSGDDPVTKDVFAIATKRKFAVCDSGIPGPTLAREINFKSPTPATYVFDKRVMQGAFGSIHPTQDVETGEMLVMKVIYLTANAKRRAMSAQDVQREYAVLTKVGSPLAPRHLGIVDRKTYAVQKGYGGDMLELGLVLSNEPMRGPILLKTFADIAMDLARTHAAGVIHRDVKPENMLHAVRCAMTLCDYGLCHEDTVCADGVVKGTPGYLAPEMVFGKSYDGKLDMFSLALSMIYLHSYNMEACPFYTATSKEKMTDACKQLTAWRIERSPTKSPHGELDWTAIVAGSGPFDILAKEMLSINPSLAPLVFEYLLEADPAYRASSAQVVPLAQKIHASLAGHEGRIDAALQLLGSGDNKHRAADRAVQERTADKRARKCLNKP